MSSNFNYVLAFVMSALVGLNMYIYTDNVNAGVASFGALVAIGGYIRSKD